MSLTAGSGFNKCFFCSNPTTKPIGGSEAPRGFTLTTQAPRERKRPVIQKDPPTRLEPFHTPSF